MKANYDIQNAAWKKYAEFKPDDGLLSSFTETKGPVASAKPIEPTTPADLPVEIQSLKFATATLKAYGTKFVAPGWGYPSQYEIKFAASDPNVKAGKYFGTLAGKNTALAAAAVLATTDA